MLYSTISRPNFQDILTSCQLDSDIPLLDTRTIHRAFAEAGCDFGYQEHTVFDMNTTTWAFLHEMMHTGKGRTLQAAVQAVQQLRLSKGLDPISANTGTYSAAREKIDAKVPQSLMLTLAKKAEEIVPDEMRLCGLKVSNLDGSTQSMPDTEANQEKYPQQKNQAAGLGFPIWRIVMLISAVTGMVQMVAFGPWRGKGTGEMSLFASFFEQMRHAASWIEVVVADRYYCAYHVLAVLYALNIKFVTRLHVSRLVDFAKGKDVKRQKNGDFHVTWKRPAKPVWMVDWMWELVPETMTLRLVRVRIKTEGGRTEGFFVVTNLMDAEKYPSEAICELYRGRWQVEVDIRTIKSFMEMDVLRAKTPKMVETEFSMGLLAYNIVRVKMLETAIAVRQEAALKESEPIKDTEPQTQTQSPTKTNKINAEDLMPRNISFSMALASIVVAYVTVHFMNEAMRQACRKQAELNRRTVQVGNRPDRMEPRCRKRRPDEMPLMKKPREVLREELRQRKSPTQSGDEAAALLGEA